MFRRVFASALAVALIAAFAAGCGGGSSSSSSSSSSAPSTSTPSKSTNPNVAQAVAQCKSSINAQSTLSASVKSKLIALCDKAASGDVSGAKKVTAQVCQEIVKATVPASAQSQALAACPKG